jgi:hypothetical protein
MTKVENGKISSLKQDPQNANEGTERGLRMLDDSLADVGLGRSVVVDKNGLLISGNKTTERAIDRGFEDTIVVHTTGDKLVVVQRDDLDLLDDVDKKARALAYYDNRVSEADLKWVPEQLDKDRNAGLDIIDKIWTPIELSEMGILPDEELQYIDYDNIDLSGMQGAGGAASNDNGASSFIVYCAFKTKPEFLEALKLLTLGERNEVREDMRYAAIDGSALLPEWQMLMGDE